MTHHTNNLRTTRAPLTLCIIGLCLALSAGAVGCGDDGDARACTLAACLSGLTVNLEGYAPGAYTLDLTQGVFAVSCALTLSAQPASPDDDQGSAIACTGDSGNAALTGTRVNLNWAGNDDAIQVTLTAEEAEVGRYEGSPWESINYPNGPECGGGCGSGAITLTANTSS